MTTVLHQPTAPGNRGWHPIRFTISRLFGLARFARRRPLAIVLLFALFIASTAIGLFLWSGQRLRDADRACRSFHKQEALRQLKLANPFRSWWDPDAQFLAARLDRLNGNWQAVEEHLRACQRLEGGSSARVQLEWVLLRAQRGEVYEREPGLWNSVLHGDPDSPFILEALASTKIRALEFTHAATLLDKWVTLDPNCAFAWERRGWVMMRLERLAQAEQSYLRALEIEPELSGAEVMLAVLYIRQFKTDEVAPLIERLLAERPDNAAVLAAGGEYRMLCGKPDEARQLLERAHNLDRTNQEILIQLAKLELQSGHLAEAELWTQRAREQEETNPEVHYLLNQVLKLQGREKEAAEQLERYQKYKEQAERFSRLLRELIPAHPNDPQYMAEFGDILFRTGQPLQAAYWHIRALQIDPNYIPSNQALADYYELSGKPAQTATHRAHLKNPTSPGASRP
jgi:predicted Zn-dependent protease